MIEQPPNDTQHIVVGVDGSEPSRAALRWAIDYAALVGAPVEAVMAWSYPVNYGVAGLPTDWSPEADALAVLDQTVASVTDAVITKRVIEGNASQVLLDETKDAQLLVVGSRGHGGFAGLLLGSVSANCAEHARCPVLVVPGKATS
jgi:nucleotide-binding universal stress UspA family protein